MKRKTLLTLGIAGAFACSTASAATFLCTQSEPNAESTFSCAEIPPGVLGSMTSGEDLPLQSSPPVTYYLVPSDQDDLALLEFAEPSDPSLTAYYFIQPTGSGEANLSSADQWQHSEPRTTVYMSSAEFDAMNPSGE